MFDLLGTVLYGLEVPFLSYCWTVLPVQVEEAKVPVRCMMAKCNAHVSSFDLPRLGMGQEDITSFR